MYFILTDKHEQHMLERKVVENRSLKESSQMTKTSDIQQTEGDFSSQEGMKNILK